MLNFFKFLTVYSYNKKYFSVEITLHAKKRKKMTHNAMLNY